ncbi:MAG: phosphoglycerate dehydrogenase [Rhodothermales bacterium]
MKVLLADKLADVAIRELQDHGHEVLSEPGVSGGQLIETVRREQPHVLVVRSTKVSATLFEAASQLELVVRAGAGYDNIDMESASGHGVFVSNCPGKNAAAVAELTMGLILAMDRSIPDNVIDARKGRWNKAGYSRSAGVKGRTLGVIGLGNIGREVIRRAQAFDMNVVAWSRSPNEARARELGISAKSSPAEVAADADVVTFHVAATPETRHLADRAFFEAMKEGAHFVNTTRASVVDEEALTWAVAERGIRAGVDVISNEPSAKEGDFEHPLASLPNVYITHHIGASTKEAQNATAAEAARVINVYAQTGRAPNCVNIAEQSPATYLLTVRHLDKVGVLAAVLDELRKAGWNVQEMENLIFEGARAACARIRFNGEYDASVIERIRSSDNVLAVSLISL